MRKSKWRIYFLILLTMTIFATFLQVLNHSHLKKTSQLRVAYDEYNCGCPRFGSPVNKDENASSLCSDWSTSRGPHQKVISYSVYGDRKIPKILTHFYDGIEDRIKEATIYYKGWTVRLYHNVTKEDVDTKKLICKLYCLYPNFDPCQIDNLFKPKSWNLKNIRSNATASSLDGMILSYVYSLFTPDLQSEEPNNETELSEISEDENVINNPKDSFAKLFIGKMWRFLPMGDDLVDDFLIRDVDSYILPREVEAVKQWQLNSTAVIHAMRDHPSQNGVILAGMWGGSRRRGDQLIKSFIQQMLLWPHREIWDYDQILLLRVVWPLVLDNVMVHDSYHCRNPFLQSRSQTVPFPTKRNGSLFVGWGPTRSKTEISLIGRCPKKCRPREHMDWELC